MRELRIAGEPTKTMTFKGSVGPNYKKRTFSLTNRWFQFDVVCRFPSAVSATTPGQSR